jgi:hypothetical protein
LEKQSALDFQKRMQNQVRALDFLKNRERLFFYILQNRVRLILYQVMI